MARPDPIGTLPERPPEVGELVQVRSRRWLVEEVTPSETSGQSPLVTLACADDDAQGQALRVYWDYEVDRILEEEGWEHLAERGFDDPRRFAAFLHTLRWHCVTATDSNLFQAPFRAGIRIDAYQMEPLRKALRLPRVNLFIADDTGLGKTIGAGLIARELLLRRKAKTIVVAAPPSVLEQWKGELEDRFGPVFEILDRPYLTRMRRERGFGVNPWMTHSRFLVSHNLLIDPGYADPMRAWLGPLRPGSLLILDEAHHAAPSSGGRYGIESKFTRAVRDLAGRFEHRLFLSATPHNGHSNSFSTLSCSIPTGSRAASGCAAGRRLRTSWSGASRRIRSHTNSVSRLVGGTAKLSPRSDTRCMRNRPRIQGARWRQRLQHGVRALVAAVRHAPSFRRLAARFRARVRFRAPDPAPTCCMTRPHRLGPSALQISSGATGCPADWIGPSVIKATHRPPHRAFDASSSPSLATSQNRSFRTLPRGPVPS